MRRQIVCLIAMAMVFAGRSSRAEDIDIFSGAPNGGRPNVLFIIDNTANWNTAFTNEMAALYNTFTNLPVNPDGSAIFNVGIMFATETGSPNNNTSGGYVRAAIRPMTSTNKALYAAMIQGFDKLKDKGNAGYSALEMAEAYYYFSGGAPYAGNSKIKADFLGNLCIGCNQTATQIAANKAVYALAGNALSSEYATTYNTPVSSQCGHNFVIYISNGPNQDSSTTDATANTKLAAAGGSTTVIPISPSGSMTNPSDEWARFMYHSSLSVVTYTIDVNPVTSGQGPGWTALLKSMADASSGKYAAVSSSTGSGSQIQSAIGADLSEVQSINSVYASVSLPVSVNTQGTYLDRVFIGMFRPDPNAAPRWLGNLKQYTMGKSGTGLQLEDAQLTNAINSLTGFITECARSYWTPASADTYWTTYGSEGLCITPSNTYSNSPDGNEVEKGAQAYWLRGGSSYSSASSDSRKVTTCSPVFSSCTSSSAGGTLSLDSFDTSNGYITQSLLDPTSTDPAATLINWERGKNNDSTNLGDMEYTTGYPIRPSVHGDVVHSRPVAINYGTDSSPKIVVFYGGNDGVFRAINANRDGEQSISGNAPGTELWAFVPPEFYGNIKRLYDNSPPITIPTVNTAGAVSKNYGIDGPITANTDNSHVWVYAPMRRGGRALYAFDATNLSSVKLKWKIGCPNNFPNVTSTGSCTTNFSGIGQTWSTAKTLKASGYSSTMLIMGGGYDTCEDADPNTCTTSTKGNSVYVVDADTGAWLQTLSTDRAVIADIAVIPDPMTGVAIYAYAVDLGGNIYRITIGSNAPSAWTITKIASLGCATVTTCTANRKFMFAPDVVLQNGVYTLLLGSGDREKPLLYTSSGSVVNSVTNYFFAVQDNPGSSTWLSSESGNCGSAVLCLSSLLAVTSSTAPAASALAAKKGWYLSLDHSEQVVTSAITIYGVINFSTNKPTLASANTCSSNLGSTYVYNVPFSSPAITRTLLPPVGLPPSPVAGMVTIDSGIGSGETVPFCIGCGSASPLAPTEPTPPAGTVPAQPKARVYWYNQR